MKKQSMTMKDPLGGKDIEIKWFHDETTSGECFIGASRGFVFLYDPPISRETWDELHDK